jgi:arabinosyltransferase
MGRLPGAPTVLPYKAPLDHILDLERALVRDLDTAEFGPNIPFREHSFLSNPRLPAAVRESVAEVHLCTPEDRARGALCSDGSAPAEEVNGTIWLNAGLNDVQIRTALGRASQTFKVLRFSSMWGAFSRHVDDADHERFVKRVRLLPSIWCCVMPAPGTPGHVWYDLWWDAVPHVDLHSRVWDKPWTIVTGP